jgi:DNA topoisomerase I
MTSDEGTARNWAKQSALSYTEGNPVIFKLRIPKEERAAIVQDEFFKHIAVNYRIPKAIPPEWIVSYATHDRDLTPTWHKVPHSATKAEGEFFYTVVLIAPTTKKDDENQPRDDWGRWTTNAANPWSHPTRHDLVYKPMSSSPKNAGFLGPPKEGDPYRNPQFESVPRWYLPKDHPAYSDAFPPPAPIVDKEGIGPGFKEERQNADGSWNVPQPGESFLVYRIDSGKNDSLQGVNAGNADGVVGFYDDMNDPEQPERGYKLGSHVSLYKVTLGKHFGEYETIRDRNTYGSPVVGRSASKEKDFNSVWYSFPARSDSHTSERVASVPMTAFPRHGFSPDAIRRAFKDHLARITLQTSATTSDQEKTQKQQFSTILKFNPFHDAKGRFTTAQNAKQQEGHDELPTVEAMNMAMQLVGMEQFERAVMEHLDSIGRPVTGAEQAYEIERVARRIVAENRGKVTKCDFTMPLQYFIEIGDAYRAFKFDESKHPREPAGTPKGGQFAQWRQGTGMYFDDKVWRYGGDHSEVPEPVAARLKGMAIPPASINVHLNPDATEPLQATWTARNGKLQYRYSAEAMGSNAAEKFSRLKDFNAAMPLLRRRSHDDMMQAKTQADRDTAAVVRLMSKTGFRVGGAEEFETKKGKAYGASTLLDRHVVVTGTKLAFNFPGKHAVMQNHELNDPLLAQYIRNRKRHTTKDERLFSTNEGRVNKYLKDVTGQPFSAKDFRTWHGTYTALKVLKEIGEPATEAEYRKARIHVGDVVSKHLGNTRMVALGSYIDPTVWGRWAGKEKTKRKKHEDD